MFELIKKFKTVIIIVVIFIIGFFLYSKFGPKPSAASTTGLVRQGTTTAGGAINVSEGPGKEFVNQLLAIQNITFDTAILTDSAYISLQDFSRELIQQPSGRPNPFAPLGSADAEITGSASSTGFVKTSDGAATSTKPSSTKTR